MTEETFTREVVTPIGKKKFTARTENQSRLIRAIKSNPLVFSSGPAGVGKTNCAIAVALELLHEKHFDRIILTRPALEAGENLGFMPGDYLQKLELYMGPMYMFIDDYITKQKRIDYMDEGRIVVAPMGFLRGTTFRDSFVLLEEAQNTTVGQMKLFLSRIGKNSKIVVSGDNSQTDLLKKTKNGFLDALTRLDGISGLEIVQFEIYDIQRSKIVQEIVERYQ